MDTNTIIARIESDLEQLTQLFVKPSAEAFTAHHEAIEQLESIMHIKTRLDAAFTYSAMAASAGSLVGSTKTIDYLTKRLGLSRSEARFRLDLADRLHRAKDSNAQACLESMATYPASTETARSIIHELRKLDHSLRSHAPELMHTALKTSATDGPDAARRLLRDLVKAKNNELDPDPQRARRNRSFRMGTQDRDGGVTFSGYAPAGDAAILEAAIASGVRCGAAKDEARDTKRSFTQLRYDALMDIIRKHESLKNVTNKGLGTVVLSLTQKDLDNLTANTEIRTNTSYTVTPFEALAMGLSENGMTVLHGPEGDPVTAISHTRSATVLQRFVLAVTEGACSHPGCDRPPIWCDAHHITAWIQGGNTSLKNLTLLCRHHHTSNDDTKKRPDRGYAERCPTTGRVAFHAPGAPPDFNNSYPANQSAGARIRAK